jgi:hypothetical protein
MRIDEMAKVKQFGVRSYMNANHPYEIDFNDTYKPFFYYGSEGGIEEKLNIRPIKMSKLPKLVTQIKKGAWFYPLASQPKSNGRFPKINGQIVTDDWVMDFSKSIFYDWDDFYNRAKVYGYGNCDVFACRVEDSIRYLIPMSTTFGLFPFRANFRGDFSYIEKRLNEIFDKVE